MIIKGILKKGEYFDSILLMMATKEIDSFQGVMDSAVFMGTKQNKSILKTSGYLIPEFKNAEDTDLLIAVKAETEQDAESALSKVHKFLHQLREKDEKIDEISPRSFEGALKLLPDANLALISVPGKYAANEAMKALKHGLHIMIFSDNVPIEQEIELKEFARAEDLLVMGPDCGTAIINGIPLAFANVVNRGDIGIVAASGTGLQEVSCIISNSGIGISQAIGTGGRDVTKEVGGIMFIESVKRFLMDKNTNVRSNNFFINIPLISIKRNPHKFIYINNHRI